MESSDIKEKAIAGSKWSIIEKFSLQIVQFIVGIILARLLGPEAFGLIALTSIFLVISGAITDGGFEKALIQNQELSVLQISTAFYINMLLGIFMALAICITAPYISNFFHTSALTDVLRVLSLSLPLNALGQTQRMLLMKELNFKKISVAQIFSAVISGIIGITLAFFGFGVWALVYSSLASTLIMVLIFWYKSHWYPQLSFSYSSIVKMIPFGLNVMASGILFFFLQQFNNFIVGKYYKETELGLFNRGMKFPEMISSIIQGVVLKIAFPLFAKLQDDEPQLKNVLRKSSGMIAFITFPLLAYMFIDAKAIVVFLLTDKWIGAVIYLQIFCLVNFLVPFISLQRELLLAKGKANLLFRLFILTSVVEIIPILLVVKYGIIYVAWVSFASKVFQFILYQLVAARKINVSLGETIKWILPPFIIVLLVTGAILLANLLLPAFILNILSLKLAIDFLIGVSLYLLLSAGYKLQELQTAKLVVQSIFKRK